MQSVNSNYVDCWFIVINMPTLHCCFVKRMYLNAYNQILHMTSHMTFKAPCNDTVEVPVVNIEIQAMAERSLPVETKDNGMMNILIVLFHEKHLKLKAVKSVQIEVLETAGISKNHQYFLKSSCDV